jgi:hypothetical protein
MKWQIHAQDFAFSCGPALCQHKSGMRTNSREIGDGMPATLMRFQQRLQDHNK